jgi:hypothetical protein
MKHPKFLTLTLLKDSGSVAERLKHLWEMRRRLFFYLSREPHYDYFGNKVIGYKVASWCGVIEPPNHIHIIIDCEYIPESVISKIWYTITGDSFIVDIRSINVTGDPRAVFGYISKYMSKAANWEGVNLSILKGFHLIASYGLKLGGKIIRAICVCGSLRPLHRIDKIDFDAMFPYEVESNMAPGGKWSDAIIVT